jgi:hypothetical protein
LLKGILSMVEVNETERVCRFKKLHVTQAVTSWPQGSHAIAAKVKLDYNHSAGCRRVGDESTPNKHSHLRSIWHPQPFVRPARIRAKRMNLTHPLSRHIISI